MDFSLQQYKEGKWNSWCPWQSSQPNKRCVHLAQRAGSKPNTQWEPVTEIQSWGEQVVVQVAETFWARERIFIFYDIGIHFMCLNGLQSRKLKKCISFLLLSFHLPWEVSIQAGVFRHFLIYIASKNLQHLVFFPYCKCKVSWHQWYYYQQIALSCLYKRYHILLSF